MTKVLIQFAYRQLIDASAQSGFERDVFTDSYNEFRMQIQTYNPDGQYTTYEQVRAAVPQSEPTLSIKVGFAIGLYVSELNGQIPGLTDALGQPVGFAEHRFALLSSDITDRTRHRVAITYRSGPLTLLETVGNYLLLASSPQPTGTTPDGPATALETFMLAMQPNLSIVCYSAAC